MEVSKMAASARGLLFSHLKQLEKKELENFKTLLKDYPADDGLSVLPRRHGKRPAYIEAANKMLSDYKEERALGIAAELLCQVNREDLSVRLRQSSQQYLDEMRRTNEANVNQRKRYQQKVMEKLKVLEQKSPPRGKHFDLKERYAELRVVQYYHGMERSHEMIFAGRKHLETNPNGAENSKLVIDKLFQTDQCRKTPRIIILQGAAGIGKTTMVRKIVHDWALGELFQDRFDYVFYIHCRDIRHISGQQTMADLLLDSYLESLKPMTSLISDAKKLLFIVDGYDELKYTLNMPECEQQKRTSKESKAMHLLRKGIFNNSYSIITSRHTALGKVDRLVRIQRYVEVLGFSQDDRKEYFTRFFENKTLAIEALNFAQKNEILYTMCFVPTVCYIVCTVAKQQMEKYQDLTDVSGTSTSIYLLFLSSLLKKQSDDSVPRTTNILKKLCCLAKEATFKKKILFDEDDLCKQGLATSDVPALSLANDLLVTETGSHSYSFVHQSFQEFLAALSYVLRDEEATRENQENLQELISLLAVCRKNNQRHLTVMVRFLFGLLNTDRLHQMEKSFRCKISAKIRPALLKWVTEEIQHGSDVDTEDLMDLFYCLYEVQDEEFARRAMQHYTNAKIGHFREQMNPLDFRMYLYCLKFVDKIQNFNISNYMMEPEDLKNLMPWLLTCSQIKFDTCSITASSCSDLCTILSANASLTELNIGNNALGDSGVQLLCKGLKNPSCKLQKLRLHCCSLADSCCADLSSMVSGSPSLTELDLSFNALGDSGLRLVCEGLKDPDCRVQKLCLDNCSLTGSCCTDLSVVFSAPASLTDLELSNNELEDSGVRQLCGGLQHPNCKIKKLSLQACSLTDSCCEGMALVLAANQSLRELNLSLNQLRDSGVTQLCEGLKHPDCRIQKLCLGWCDFTGSSLRELASALHSHRHLTELDIGGNDLGDHAVEQLCEGLKQEACTLETLVLCHSSLAAACCGYLSSVLLVNQSLTDLQLASNYLEDSGVIQLCEGLKHPGCKMRHLNLNMTGISDGCLSDLCAALCVNREIRTLRLQSNSISDLSIASLQQLIETCASLTDLRLSFNEFSSIGRQKMNILMKERAHALTLFDSDTMTTGEW